MSAEAGSTDARSLENLLRQQESLRAVIESISSELALRPLLTQIVHHACQLLQADRGSIGLYDEARQVIRTEAVYRMPPEEVGLEVGPGVGLAGRVLATGQPILLEQYGQVDNPIHQNILDDTVIGLPIYWRERLIGFFGIGAAPPRRFTEQDVQTLSLFARHAAIAIENARLFSVMQRSLDEARLLYETSRRISTAMTLDEVIMAYLQQVASRADYACNIVLYEFDESGKRTARITRGRWAPNDGLQLLNHRDPYEPDNLDPPLDAGETITISDVRRDPRVPPGLREVQIAAGKPAIVLIPLMVHGQRIGLVVLTSPEVQEWEDVVLWPYEVTAAQLASAIAHRRQQQSLYEWGQQAAVFAERQRLARELHDSVTQLIFSVTLIAQSLAPAFQRDLAEGMRRVDRLLELSQAALAEMRALLYELRPLDLPPRPAGPVPGLVVVEQEGLARAMQQHMALMVHDGLTITLQDEAYVPQVSAHEEALFRITQEALNNVVKHAHASRVEITLAVAGDTCTLVVKDDGRGFSANVNRQQGLGLGTMRERAQAIGGQVSVESRPEQGTTVTAQLPRKDRHS